MQEYIEREGKMIKVQVTYDKGGYSYISSRMEKRGYTMLVVPVELKNEGSIQIEKTRSYTGKKLFLKEVQRYSKKSEAEAIAIAKEKMEDLIEHVLEMNQ